VVAEKLFSGNFNIFGLSYVRRVGDGRDREGDDGRAVVITTNAGGAAWTADEGSTWFTLPGVTGYWAVAFASPKAGWLVGTGGTILKISLAEAVSCQGPQGLKPASLLAWSSTAEAVPFPNHV